MTQSTCKKGFSLIELLCCVAIVLTIATLSMGSFNYISRFIMRAELLHIKQLFHASRLKARASGKETAIHINVSNNSIEWEGMHHALPSFFTWGTLPNVKGPPSSPQKIVTSATTFSKNTVCCSPSGIIGSGTIYIKDTRNSTQYALTCGISQSSFVRLYRWNEGVWHVLI